METFSIITASIFIASILLEVYLNAKDNLDHYDKQDSNVNVTIALIGVGVNLIVKSFAFTLFLYFTRFSITTFDSSVITWFSLFLLTDLQYYLFHWLGHKSRFFWAMHVIHHSSPMFNLTTAIRTPFTNSIFRFTTLIPFVLAGFNPMMVIWMDSLVVSFTFFQHTEMVKKLGWLEYIFSTPSHHRVHHSSNEKYIDKNFGAVLIIWDKLFGTFQKEDERPVYGITKPLKKNEVLHVIFHEWRDMIDDVKRASCWSDRLNYIFSKPGWSTSSKSFVHSVGLSFLVRRFAILFLLILLSVSISLAQDSVSKELLQNAILAETRFDEATALKVYREILIADPYNLEALWRASRIHSNFAGRNTNKSEKHKFAEEALLLAQQAIKQNPKSKDAHLSYIIALGILSEAAASPSDKLTNAKIIYSEALLLLSLDSLYAPAHFILGKWHLEISKLNWAERLACNVLFGGVPKGASYEKAVSYFDKAVELQPGYILFYFGKASALYYAGNYNGAISVLEKAIRLMPIEPDDKQRLQKCRDLLRNTRAIHSKVNEKSSI